MEPDIMDQKQFPSPTADGCGPHVLFPPTLPPGNSSFEKWSDSQFQENIIEYLETVCHQIMRLMGELRRRRNEHSEASNNVQNINHHSASGISFPQDSQLHDNVHEARFEFRSETKQETELRIPSVGSNTVEDENYGSDQNDRYCLSKAIQKNFRLLVEVLPYRDSELPDILGEVCLTDNENSRIRNQPQREDQVRQLLRTIMGRTFSVMKYFLDYSRKFNPEEVELVWKTFGELKRQGVVEKRCVLCRMMAHVDIKYVADILYERELVPADFHGRVSDSVEFVGCQDKLWGELAILCKRPRCRSAMLDNLITALEKKEKYRHFVDELHRYGTRSLTCLKCTCQSNYKTGNKSSAHSTKQNRVAFCQRVESFRSSSGSTSLSPWSSHSDVNTHDPSARLQERFRKTGLQRVSSLRGRALSRFSRRRIGAKSRNHKLLSNQDDKNNETKDKENESTNKYIKSHNAVIELPNALRAASDGTQHRISLLSYNSEVQSLDEDKPIKDAFTKTVLFKNNPEVISIENGHTYYANSIHREEQERYEDDYNADLPETVHKMLPEFLKDARHFSGADESSTTLARSNSSPLSPTRPVYLSKYMLLNDNNVIRDIPNIDISDIDNSQNKSEGSNIHSADKTDDNKKDNLIEFEISEDKTRKENFGHFEDNNTCHSNTDDLLNLTNGNIRLDDGTDNSNMICQSPVTNVIDVRPKGRIIRRKRRLNTIPSPAHLKGDDFNETENSFDARKPLLSKYQIDANSQIFQDVSSYTDNVMKEGGEEINTLNKNTRRRDSDQYGNMWASNQPVDSGIMTNIKPRKVADQKICEGGQTNESADMNNRLKDMVLKYRATERMHGIHDEMSKSLIVPEIENPVSPEKLSQQVQKMRSRSFWGRFKYFLRSKKKDRRDK